MRIMINNYSNLNIQQLSEVMGDTAYMANKLNGRQHAKYIYSFKDRINVEVFVRKTIKGYALDIH